MNQIKLTLFFLFSAFSWSSLDSILEVNGGKVGSKSDVESRLKDTELFFFLGLNISYVFVTLVGAMVIGGTHSFDSTISASLYCCNRKSNILLAVIILL